MQVNQRPGWPFPSQEDQGFSVDVETDLTVSPQSLGICITHCMGENGKGGVTMAWRKASDTKNARMIEVAVAYCSPTDTFTKRIGKQLALENFLAGETVFVPARTEKTDDSIPYNLRNMFWYVLAD